MNEPSVLMGHDLASWLEYDPDPRVESTLDLLQDLTGIPE